MRGIFTGYAMRIVYALILVIVLVFLVRVISSSIFSYNEDKTCEAATRISGLGARYGEIDQRQQDDLIASRCGYDIITFEERTSDERVMDTLSREMVSCWQSYGRGQENLFGGDIGENVWCQLCAYAQIEGDGSLPISEHLNSERIKGGSISYAEFLGNVDLGLRYEEPFRVPPTELQRGEDYGVIFYYVKDVSFFRDRVRNALVAAGGGNVVGVAGGAIVATSLGLSATNPFVLGGILIGGANTAFAGGLIGGILDPQDDDWSDPRPYVALVPWEEDVLLNVMGCSAGITNIDLPSNAREVGSDDG